MGTARTIAMKCGIMSAEGEGQSDGWQGIGLENQGEGGHEGKREGVGREREGEEGRRRER